MTEVAKPARLVAAKADSVRKSSQRIAVAGTSTSSTADAGGRFNLTTG